MRVELNSPYGKLTTPGGGVIENGRHGEQIAQTPLVDKYPVVFDGETEHVNVPGHWLQIIES